MQQLATSGALVGLEMHAQRFIGNESDELVIIDME